MATYQTLVLMNLSRWDNPNKPGTGYTLDVVHQLQDGKSKGVGVEKAYFKDNGDKRMPKMLGRLDFKKCAEHWPKILALMDNPPPLPAPTEPEPIMGGTLGGTGGMFQDDGHNSLGGGNIGGGKIEKDDF